MPPEVLDKVQLTVKGRIEHNFMAFALFARLRGEVLSEGKQPMQYQAWYGGSFQISDKSLTD